MAMKMFDSLHIWKTKAYLQKLREAELYQWTIQKFSVEKAIVFEGLQEIHPKLDIFFAQYSPEALNSLIMVAGPVDEAAVVGKLISTMTSEEHLHLLYRHIFRSSISSNPFGASAPFPQCFDVIDAMQWL